MPISVTSRGWEPPKATTMAFVDAGYLIAGARKLTGLEGKLQIDGEQLDFWARNALMPFPSKTLRTYVYDGAHDPADPDYPAQRAYFDRLAATDGIRLRLGHLQPRQSGRGGRSEQKGVDTLLVLDLVRMAQQQAFEVALIVAGDRDLAEALRVIADDYSRRVVLYSVEGHAPHRELPQVADFVGEMARLDAESIVRPVPVER